LNVVELRISAFNDGHEDVCRGYTESLIFGPVLKYLSADGTTIPKTKKERRISERAKSYFLEDGLLYHKLSGGKLCIPDNLQTEDIQKAHDTILGGGHTGIEKTIPAVASHFHWPTMTDPLPNWVHGCDVCH